MDMNLLQLNRVKRLSDTFMDQIDRFNSKKYVHRLFDS